MALENPWLATTFTIEFPLLCLLVCLGVAFHIVWNCRIGRPLRSEDQVFASTYSRRNTCFDQTRLLEDIANATEFCKGCDWKSTMDPAVGRKTLSSPCCPSHQPFHLPIKSSHRLKCSSEYGFSWLSKRHTLQGRLCNVLSLQEWFYCRKFVSTDITMENPQGERH